MANVQSLLRRVQRLERARETPQSPFELAYGSLGAFTDKVNADIGAGKLDRTDAPVLVECLRRWHKDRVWARWQPHRNGL